MNGNKNSKLILGMGNDILMDDAIGPKLVQGLQKALKHPQVTFHTATTGGLEIIEMIREYEKAIIIDGIKTKDGVPGTIYHLTPAHFKETLHLSNFHDVSFLTALDMAEKMGISIPYQIDIIAIEIVEDLTFSNEFSQSIADNYKQIYEEVLELAQKLIQ